jgi:hypothetical protein
MQIHELNRPRRTDEGFMDVVKGVGGAAKTALAQAVSPGVGTTQDFRASSAGILDPKKKLDAVMKNSQMAGLATKYADEWLKDARSQVSAAPAPAPAPVAAPAPAAGKLTPQQIAAKKAELQGKRAAGKTTATQTGSGFKDYVGGSQNKLITNPDGSTSMKKLQRESTYYNFDYILESIININEKAAVANQPVTKPAPATVNAQGFNYNNVMKMPGMEKYATPPAGQPKPGQPPAGQPTPGQPPVAQPLGQPDTDSQPPAGQAQPPVAQPKPGQPPVAQPPAGQAQPPAGQAQPPAGQAQPPADSEYIKNFLEFANEKVAMRDSATYKMLGLTDAEGVTELKPELDDAKQAVKDAQGDPAKTKEAVKNYILTAMAALQLVTSQNSVKAASPEAPAYGQQPPPAAGTTGAAAGTAPATGQLTGASAVKLLNDAGLTAQILTTAGKKIQAATGNKKLSTSGDSVIDTMLQGMGYTV